MTRKLTITVSQELYSGLHAVVGRRHISQFLERLARPHVIEADLDTAYREMGEDEARERAALEWSEGTVADGAERADDPPTDPLHHVACSAGAGVYDLAM